MKLRRWMTCVLGCAVVVALTAVVAAAVTVPAKTYIGQTDWQRAQEQAYMSGAIHRTGVHSMFTSKMTVSAKGIETVLISGNCGSMIHHSDAKTPTIPIRNGLFRTSWMHGRVTATKITGIFSTDGSARCTTKFTLTAKSG